MGQIGWPGLSVECVRETCLAHLDDRLDAPAIDRELAQDRIGGKNRDPRSP